MPKPVKQFPGRQKTRTVSGGGVKGGKRPELPVNSAPSNEAADMHAQLIFLGIATASVLLVGGLLAWGVSMLIQAFTSGHVLWMPLIVGGLLVGACIFMARTLAWLSYFGAMLYAMKTNAWESVERLARGALAKWKLFPGGASTAALMLVQSLMSRGKFDEVIEVANEQWTIHQNDPKFSQALAPMYSAVGMAYQVKGETKESILWTERGIEMMERTITQLVEKKTWEAKLAGPQAIETTKQLRAQLCIAFCNVATSYFNQQSHRKAKEMYKRALDYANQAPDFPEKADIVRVSKEQMARLKHV